MYLCIVKPCSFRVTWKHWPLVHAEPHYGPWVHGLPTDWSTDYPYRPPYRPPPPLKYNKKISLITACPIDHSCWQNFERYTGNTCTCMWQTWVQSWVQIYHWHKFPHCHFSFAVAISIYERPGNLQESLEICAALSLFHLTFFLVYWPFWNPVENWDEFQVLTNR